MVPSKYGVVGVGVCGPFGDGHSESFCFLSFFDAVLVGVCDVIGVVCHFVSEVGELLGCEEWGVVKIGWEVGGDEVYSGVMGY